MSFRVPEKIWDFNFWIWGFLKVFEKTGFQNGLAGHVLNYYWYDRLAENISRIDKKSREIFTHLKFLLHQQPFSKRDKTCVSSMILSARATVPPVKITVLLEVCFVLKYFEKGVSTDDLCKNSDHYRMCDHRGRPSGSIEVYKTWENVKFVQKFSLLWRLSILRYYFRSLLQ